MARTRKQKKDISKKIQKTANVFLNRGSKKVKENVKLLAEEFGVLTKQGKISGAKKNRKKLQAFQERLSSEYGKTYTEYSRKRRERMKRVKKSAEERGININISASKYYDVREDLNQLYEELYKYAYDKKAIDGNVARDIMDIAEEKMLRGNPEDAVRYIKSKLNDIKDDYNKKLENEFEDAEDFEW